MGKSFDEFLATIDKDALTDAVCAAMERSIAKQETLSDPPSAEVAVSITAIHASREICTYYLRAYHEWAQKQG